MRHVWKAYPLRTLVACTALAVAVGTLSSVAQRTTTAQVAARAEADNTHHARELSRSFRQAAEAILPTVVTIETRTKARTTRVRPNSPNSNRDNPFRGTPFEDFFNDDSPLGRRFFGGEEFLRQQPRSGTGSGVIIDKSGIVLTNNHVVEGADEVIVRLADDREFRATDIKTDPHTDLAVVRIKDAGSLPAARLGDSSQMEIGDWVLAVGAPFGLNSTVSAGIISGKGREFGGQRTRYLQTDAAINPGNSGGPLVNLDGEVVGINTAIATNSGGYQGIGFAIPVNLAKWVTDQLVSSGSVRRAYLGVQIQAISAELAEKFGVQRNQGVLLAEVFPNSPAAEAGFQEGDVITEFAGVKVHSPRDLQEVVEQAPLNSKQAVTLLRDGKPKTLEVVVKPLPENFGKTARNDSRRGSSRSGDYTHEDYGLTVTPLTDQLAENLGFGAYKGVVVSEVDPDGLAYEAGLREGDLIMRVNDKPVRSIDEFKAALPKTASSEGVSLLVRSEGGNRFVALGKKK